MAESINQISIALFNYMCQHVVGTEKVVKMKRILNTVKSTMECNFGFTKILSGSLGEGLEMAGSDRDYMYVERYMPVFEDTTTIQYDPTYTHSVFVMEDTKAGFTKLRLIYNGCREAFEICTEVDGVLYLSNLLYKLSKRHIWEIGYAVVIHGPCLSDINGVFDNAFCLHCKLWISPANQWITRHRGMWPDVDVMSKIIDHGVLFVPVGCKGSPNEDIEWRISFSVGEKLLIYSFTHTQLLCYALMKILLKDVINRDNRCKDLLCSYFIKTILFWISEELPVAMWRPENLIQCFMQCVNRLIYCVKHSMCPHYFIHDKNLFESKIEGERRTYLLENLNNIISMDWRCIFLAKQLQTFHIGYNVFSNKSQSFANTVEDLLASFTLAHCMFNTKIKFKDSVQTLLQNITVLESSRLKLVFLYWFSRHNIHIAENLVFRVQYGNKVQYKQYKEQLCCILQSLFHDAVSGWLNLASFFYQMKQYNIAIYVLSHALSKCTAEKTQYGNKFESNEPRQLLHFNCWKKNVLNACIKLGIFDLSPSSYLIPKEVQTMHTRLPPVVYAHFLCFMCHYHRKEIRQCYNSIRNLELTLTEGYFISNFLQKTLSCQMYGIALQLVGEYDAARLAFLEAAERCNCEGCKLHINWKHMIRSS